MPIRIVLRKDRALSPFRRALEQLVAVPELDELWLCSGYIWEPQTGYKVLDDILPGLRISGLRGAVSTIAGKLERPEWTTRYSNFVGRLKTEGFLAAAYTARTKNWHAKIAIGLTAGVPRAGIVGSSNLTGPALREGSGNWNFEGDVLLWKDTSLNRHFRPPDDVETRAGTLHTLDALLDPTVHQPDEEAHLRALLDDMRGDLQRFEERRT
jgi:hypothetical protein